MATRSQPATVIAPTRAVSWRWARINWLPRFIARRLFGQPLAPTAAEWTTLTQALSQGDPAMDAVIDWIYRQPKPGTAKKDFDQALTQGIHTLTNPAAELVTFFQHLEQPPAWLEPARLDRGARACHLAGRVSFLVLRDMALMGGYAYFNSMNHTLDVSGALSQKTARRLGETGKWLNDVTALGGMNRFGNGFITTIQVRLIHALVRRHLLQQPDFDTAVWGLPINQIDMLATYLAFGPVSLMGYRLLGIPLKKQEADDQMHLWRYIGWLMGLDEQWLAKTEGDGLRKLYHAFLTHRLPDNKIRVLGRALMEEPLNNPANSGWRRWYLYHLHLSNSALILGPAQRKQLGLPWYAVPWYPLLSAPLRFIQVSWHRLKGNEGWERFMDDKRNEQSRLLENYFPDEKPKIIEPDAQHPAHVK